MCSHCKCCSARSVGRAKSTYTLYIKNPHIWTFNINIFSTYCECNAESCLTAHSHECAEREKHANTVTRQEHGQCDVTSPLDGTIAQTYNLLHRFTGMDDRYSAKTITGTNWVRYDIHIYAKKMPVWSCVSM